MKCQTCQEHWDEVLDNAETPLALEVQEHLASCEGCQEEWNQLLEMRAELSALREISAPEDAWLRLEAVLDEEAEKEKQTRKEAHQSGWQATIRRWASSIRMGWAWGVGALLVCWIGSMWFWSGRTGEITPRQFSKRSAVEVRAAQSPPRKRPKRILAKRTAVRASSPSPSRRFRSTNGPMHRVVKAKVRLETTARERKLRAVLEALEQASKQYERAIAALEKVAQERLRRGSKQLQTTRRHLVRLERQIQERKEHIQREPMAVRAHRELLGMYRKKVDLLQQIVLGEG